MFEEKDLYFYSTNELKHPVKYLQVRLSENIFGLTLFIGWFLDENPNQVWILGNFRERIEFSDYIEDYIGFQLRNTNWHNNWSNTNDLPFYDEVMEILKNKFQHSFPAISIITDKEYNEVVKNYTAQSGIQTPHCSCRHDGMGASWHGSECNWIKQKKCKF